MPPELRGDHAWLRPLLPKDLVFCERFANDPDLRGWLRFIRPLSEHDERAWLDDMIERDAPTWLITEPQESGAPLGIVALEDVDVVAGAAQFGIGIVEPTARGRGVGEDAMRLVLSHAFGTLRLQRIWLHVHADNPARRLYTRLGLKEEGILRRHVWKRGAFRDVIVMSTLREEWTV